MNQSQTIALYQPMLVTIACKLVQCKADAEDIVQETFLKWLSRGPQKIDNIKAYLIKAVTNKCLNHLDSLRRKKEELLEQVSASEMITKFKELNLAHLDLEVRLAAAFKIVHTKLEPLERAVFLLKEVFDVEYEVLQETLNKKKEHCRQLLSRAKRKLQLETLRRPDSQGGKATLLERFRESCDLGSVNALIDELKKDITDSPRP